ncbi:MAG TPA: SMC-Scp complex subunit ScpB [Candidatus Gastranaerophilales bacterium]|nr:SMC-Scp complex subunit ScpB [Candidatus Gastranaerophilales bacterium]
MTLKCRIEAALFVIGKAVTVEEIAEIVKAKPEEVESELLDLLMDYSSRESALEIDDENGYIIQVREEYKDIVEKLIPVELKPPVLRTLSVIALKEPLRQSSLKELRGATAYDHIAELLEKGLITRKKDKNGRSFILKTTPKFAEYFKLKGDTKALAKILDLNKKTSKTIVENEETEGFSGE